MKFSKMHGGNRYAARLAAVAVCASVLVLTGIGVQAEVPGTATVSGTVTASESFTAAQVYLRNLDRDMVYMVYTNQGQFRAVALFPGTYEVSASTKHLESDVRTVTLGAGDAGEVDLTLGELSGDAPPLVIPAGRTAMESGRAGAFEYASYDEIYPPGPGKEVAEQVCMACHGENFFPTRPGTERQWMSWIDHMVGSTLGEQDPTRYAQGLLSFGRRCSASGGRTGTTCWRTWSRTSGPTASAGACASSSRLRSTKRPSARRCTSSTTSPRTDPTRASTPTVARDRVARYGQDPRFDADGNVWLVDRGIPHRLVKLDPRTGEQWEYLYPDPRNGNHEILIDPSGLIWLPEHRGRTGAKEKRLLGFNPETETFEYQIPMDPGRCRPQPDEVPAVARDGFEGQHLHRLDHGRRHQQVGPGDGRGVRAPHPDPARHPPTASLPTATTTSGSRCGAAARSSSSTRRTTRGPSSPRPPTRGYTRRLNVDSQNNIWWGIYSAGKRPASWSSSTSPRAR